MQTITYACHMISVSRPIRTEVRIFFAFQQFADYKKHLTPQEFRNHLHLRAPLLLFRSRRDADVAGCWRARNRPPFDVGLRLLLHDRRLRTSGNGARPVVEYIDEHFRRTLRLIQLLMSKILKILNLKVSSRQLVREHRVIRRSLL